MIEARVQKVVEVLAVESFEQVIAVVQPFVLKLIEFPLRARRLLL